MSNFTVDLLAEARDVLDTPIVVDQVHPKLPPADGERAELLPYAAEHDTDPVAWSPLVIGAGLDLPAVVTLRRNTASARRW